MSSNTEIGEDRDFVEKTLTYVYLIKYSYMYFSDGLLDYAPTGSEDRDFAEKTMHQFSLLTPVLEDIIEDIENTHATCKKELTGSYS